MSDANFADGEIHGLWTMVDAKGRKIASWEIENGQLNGKSILWFSNGVKRFEVCYETGVLHGKMFEWKSDGTLVSKRDFEEGCELGVVYRDRHKNGKLKIEGAVIRAKQVTKTEIDWWKGVLHTEVVDTFGKDKRVGLWVFRYSDGEKQLEIEYDDDEPHGRVVGWYPNGQKSVEGIYKHGKQHDKWTWWHSNGQKKVEGLYEQGNQFGNWLQWRDDGKVVYVEFHSLPNESATSEPEQLYAEVDKSDKEQDSPEIEPLHLNSAEDKWDSELEADASRQRLRR